MIRQSAANQILEKTKKVGSSETTRENSIQLHFTKRKYPNSTIEFGYYLAGLIDGDGWISAPNKQKHIIIAFHIKDITTAYWIKKKLQFGSVYIRAESNSCTFSLTSLAGLTKLVKLVGNKLQLDRKRTRLAALAASLALPAIPSLQKETISLCTHYLAGLVDADGNLDIYVLFRPKRNSYEVRLRVRLDLQVQDRCLIENMKFLLGGSMSFRNKTSSYRYDSVSFKNCATILKYLDDYQLLSKYKEYRYLKKALFLIQSGYHKTADGLKKICFYQKQICRLKKVK
jgi:hypothetical protein